MRCVSCILKFNQKKNSETVDEAEEELQMRKDLWVGMFQLQMCFHVSDDDSHL